jgi:peptidoglycan DL-endopeptidase CwlO
VAIRVARRHWPAVLITGLLVAFIAPSVASAIPGAPAPHPQTVAGVQRQLGRLSVQNSQLVEQYNQARVTVTKAQAEAGRAQQAASAAEAAYQQARSALAAAVTAQYEGGGFGLTGALLSSGSGESYLDRLNTMSAVSTHTAQIVAGASGAEQAAMKQRHVATALLAVTTSKRDALAARHAAVQRQVAKYTALLATLDAAQRQAFLTSANPSLPLSAIQGMTFPGASKAAVKAVRFALAQVGKPYVFGAAGPSSFDCSGLTMASWASAGVGLPHSAADQYNYGHHVAMNALTPGDLLFMYQPIGHVAIYIGDGLMVSAPTEGENVSIVPLSAFTSDVTGATHLG